MVELFNLAEVVRLKRIEVRNIEGFLYQNIRKRLSLSLKSGLKPEKSELKNEFYRSYHHPTIKPES